MSYARTPYFSIIQPVSDCHQTVTIGPVPEIRIECKASCRRCSLDPRAVKFELRDFPRAHRRAEGIRRGGAVRQPRKAIVERGFGGGKRLRSEERRVGKECVIT